MYLLRLPPLHSRAVLPGLVTGTCDVFFGFNFHVSDFIDFIPSLELCVLVFTFVTGCCTNCGTQCYNSDCASVCLPVTLLLICVSISLLSLFSYMKYFF